MEDQDEATMRPWEAGPPVDPGAGGFVVKAKFTLADGSNMEGMLWVSGIGCKSLGVMQPAIMTEEGHVSFWCGMFKPKRAKMDELYKRLGKTAKQLFPLQFRSMTEIIGGPYKGVIEGFYQLLEIPDGPREPEKVKVFR